jgi:hypothetical protein
MRRGWTCRHHRITLRPGVVVVGWVMARLARGLEASLVRRLSSRYWEEALRLEGLLGGRPLPGREIKLVHERAITFALWHVDRNGRGRLDPVVRASLGAAEKRLFLDLLARAGLSLKDYAEAQPKPRDHRAEAVAAWRAAHEGKAEE